jgi:hypothetical protein
MILLLFEKMKINDHLGYLLAVLCLWSQAQPWGCPLAAINGDVFSSHHQLLMYY